MFPLAEAMACSPSFPISLARTLQAFSESLLLRKVKVELQVHVILFYLKDVLMILKTLLSGKKKERSKWDSCRMAHLHKNVLGIFYCQTSSCLATDKSLMISVYRWVSLG